VCKPEDVGDALRIEQPLGGNHRGHGS
jgi:hypothetical protein